MTSCAVDEFAAPVQRFIRRRVARGVRLTVGFQTIEMGSHTSGLRKDWSAWIKRHRSLLDGVYVTVHSPIMNMSLSLANKFTGNLITGCKTVEDFHNCLRVAAEKSQAAYPDASTPSGPIVFPD